MTALTPPPLPAFEGLHPIVVHFPIGLLLAAPVLVVLSLANRRGTQFFALSALTILLLGLGGLFLAVSTGEAAEATAAGVPGFGDVLHRHEELGELARNVFAVLIGVYAALVIAQIALYDKFPRKARTVIFGVWLIAYLGGCLILANTAHQGGQLVHTYAVRAKLTDAPPIPPAPSDTTPAPSGETHQDERE